MKKYANIMGMPVVIDVVDKKVSDEDINEVFSYFHYIDEKFSTYKKTSEISQINNKQIFEYSNEMKKILNLSDETKNLTNGYFDININGKLDPSGIVKGYAISNGAEILRKKGFKNFYVEIAGDIQVEGKNYEGKKWSVGIQNPFNRKQIIKVLQLTNMGIATSGNYIRGKHINNPKVNKKADEIALVTVIAKDIYDADRFATAAFAMGIEGIGFLENKKGIEGYVVTKQKRGIFTTGFEKYILN